MGLDFEFQAGEGPVVHQPVRTADDVDRLRTDRASELGYVAEAIERVVAHFKDASESSASAARRLLWPAT